MTVVTTEAQARNATGRYEIRMFGVAPGTTEPRWSPPFRLMEGTRVGN